MTKNLSRIFQTNMSRILFLFLVAAGIGITHNAQAQNTENFISSFDTASIYRVSTYSGATFIGKILSMDEREVLMILPVRGRLVIPAHEIKSIILLEEKNFDDSGDYIDPKDELSHYILNTNALGLNNNEFEVGVSWLGPDVIFGISDRKSFRVSTTWVAFPILMTYNYQIPLADKLNLSVGMMGGWASWADPSVGMALPYAGLTMGSARSNVTVTAGKGRFFGWDGAYNLPYYSIAGVAPMSRKWSFILDSYLTEEVLSSWNGTGITQYRAYQFMGQLAFRHSFGKAYHIQFGGGIIVQDGFVTPLPLFHFFKKF